MCGRYVSAASAGELASFFGVDESLNETVVPNFNLAPTDPAPVVLGSRSGPSLTTMRWGYLPHWAKRAADGAKMINARVETIAEKPAFSSAIEKRRCLVPASAFYEWTAALVPGSAKPYRQPWCIKRGDGRPFVFGGIYSRWRPEPDAAPVDSYAIITRAAEGQISDIHDRMPLMVPQSDWEAWLDCESHDAFGALSRLADPPEEPLDIYPVSTAVNSVRNSGPGLWEPGEIQGSLL